MLIVNARLFLMNKIFFVLIFGLIFIGFVSGTSVDDEVLNAFDIGEERVRVFMKTDSDAKTSKLFRIFNSKSMDVEEIIGEDNVNKKVNDYISAYIDREDLERLVEDGLVESIFMEQTYHTLLQDSVDIVNASSSWNLKANGLNLTGTGQTVCIIDTGINYSHQDFGGCNTSEFIAGDCAKVIGGWDFCSNDNVFCTGEDNDPMDVHGHGTEVSGIVTASGEINGVGPGTNIVMMKAANSSGVFFTIDLLAAIDRCVINASAFNISVISMSLGGGQYSNYCDSDSLDNIAITTSINNAVANNISVVIATGNTGEFPNPADGISSPSCIQNATRVTASDKSDAYANYAFRHANFPDILVAPGSSINSTSLSGTYIVDSGTSLAAPMVSGAIAIINQYLRISGQTKTTDEIEDVLNDTGVVLYDSSESGYNFSRIDIYSAILSLDIDPPNITFDSPANDSQRIFIDPDINVTFVCNATDWQLTNSTLQVWNSSGLYYNSTENFTGTSNSSSFNVTDMDNGAYVWNCLWSDVLGNSGYATSNYSLTVGGISVSLIFPINNNYTNINDTNFSCKSISESNYELSNITFNLWNSSEDLIYNLTSDISEFENTTDFNYTFSEEGNYSWNCFGVNNVTNSTWASSNYSIVYDITGPNIISLEESVSTTAATITWSTDEPSNSSISGDVSNSSSTLITSHSLSISGLSASTSYSYTAKSCDKTGNCANSTGEFTTSEVVSSTNGGNEGGGSYSGYVGSASYIQNFTLTKDELITRGGSSRNVAPKDKIIFDLDSGKHVLTVLEITSNSAKISIESDPINLTLFIGEERKLNLSSLDYYDLYLILNNISSGKANIGIQRINESIYPDKEIEVPVKDGEFQTMDQDLSDEISFHMKIIEIGLAIIGVVLIIILIDRFIFYKKIMEYMKKRAKKLKRSKPLKINDKNEEIKT